MCAALVLLLGLGWPRGSSADTQRDRFSAGGYFRMMTRPDFQGGNSRLGLWNLYGRLLNEGPWAALELKLNLLDRSPDPNAIWTSVHAKIEGGSFATMDSGGGRMDNFRVTRLHVVAGNILLPNITWQLGTLYNTFGDLGLYDMAPAAVFTDPSGLTTDTVGLSARYNTKPVEILLGIGDAGYFLRGTEYNTIFTGGGYVRARLGDHFELGLGGQAYLEPTVPGNRYAPHQTPSIATYEDYYRGEVAQKWVDANPGLEDRFPRPEPTEATSYKAIAYLGFGKLGPLRWSNFFAHFRRLHPNNFVVESYQGREYTIYDKKQTDERYVLLAGNEMQWTLIPDRLDAAWGVLYGNHFDRDNEIAPGDDNRTYYSTVARLQLYLSPSVHILLESSVAREKSTNGRLYREHYDSLFYNDGTVADANGLQFGDTNQRFTCQFKGGLILSPLGPGIYTRPSLRLLYGLQYANVHNAFVSNFADSLDQYNRFPEDTDRHWHSVVAIEGEGWF